MTIQDALNRGFNLLATAITALAGFAFLPEAFLENELADKMDDATLFLIGVAGIAWYLAGRNKYVRSVVPVVLVVLALVVKAIGLHIEFGDAEAVGDDFGGLILFALAAALVVYQFKKTKKLLASNAAA